MRILRTFLVVASAILLPACHDEGTEPCASCPAPGKRNYVWTVDTLAYTGSFQTNMSEMYASSARNVYIVGHNDRPGPGTMYRYDGSTWKTTGFHAAEGGSIGGPVSLQAITGSGSDDIWAVGERIYTNPTPPPNFLDSSLMIHFNGQGWSEYPNSGGRALYSVWEGSANDVWAAGAGGTMHHFNGTNWTKYDMGNDYFYTSIAGTRSGNVYTVGNREDWMPPNDSAAYFLFRYDGVSWQPIDTVIKTLGAPPAHFGVAVWSDRIRLYSLAPNIYQYVSNQWQKLFDGPVGHMSKSSALNIFAVGQSVYHFNGTDWIEYAQFNNSPSSWAGCYTDGNEVFIVGNDNRRTYVVHGK